MKRRSAAQIDHCDWKPALVSKKYKDNYDSIFRTSPLFKPREGYETTLEGTSGPYRLRKIEKEEENEV